MIQYVELGWEFDRKLWCRTERNGMKADPGKVWAVCSNELRNQTLWAWVYRNLSKQNWLYMRCNNDLKDSRIKYNKSLCFCSTQTCFLFLPTLFLIHSHVSCENSTVVSLSNYEVLLHYCWINTTVFTWLSDAVNVVILYWWSAKGKIIDIKDINVPITCRNNIKKQRTSM